MSNGDYLLLHRSDFTVIVDNIKLSHYHSEAVTHNDTFIRVLLFSNGITFHCNTWGNAPQRVIFGVGEPNFLCTFNPIFFGLPTYRR